MGREGRSRSYLYSDLTQSLAVLHREEFVHIGIIRKAFGYKGHLRVELTDAWQEDLKSQSFVFIGVEGFKVPFFIESYQDSKNVVLKVQHIDDPETLKSYQGAHLYLLKKDISSGAQLVIQKEEQSSLIGTQIIDQHLGELGAIVRVDSYPQQEMAILLIKDKEVMIPMHPDLIIKRDEANMVIHMDLPAGLV
jgi:RimM protein, required for 16S rRNA processing